MHPDCYDTIACENVLRGLFGVVLVLMPAHYAHITACVFTILFHLNERVSPQKLATTTNWSLSAI